MSAIKKTCQCRVHQDFAYVGNVETYPSAKTLAGIVPQKNWSTQKYDQLYLREKYTSTKNVKCNDTSEHVFNMIECLNKFKFKRPVHYCPR